MEGQPPGSPVHPLPCCGDQVGEAAWADSHAEREWGPGEAGQYRIAAPVPRSLSGRRMARLACRLAAEIAAVRSSGSRSVSASPRRNSLLAWELLQARTRSSVTSVVSPWGIVSIGRVRASSGRNRVLPRRGRGSGRFGRRVYEGCGEDDELFNHGAGRPAGVGPCVGLKP